MLIISEEKYKLTFFIVMLGKNPLTTNCMDFDSIVVRNLSITLRFDPSPWSSKLNPFLKTFHDNYALSRTSMIFYRNAL